MMMAGRSILSVVPEESGMTGAHPGVPRVGLMIRAALALNYQIINCNNN